MARTRLNDYGPLLELRCYEDAHALLQDCRAVFEREGHVEMLGKVFGALAHLEGELGHGRQAIAFSETALRYTYLAGNREDCAIGHFNLAESLMRGGGPPKVVLAHRLAAGVIDFQTGSGGLVQDLSALVWHLTQSAPDLPPLPDSFDELCRIVEAVEGVRFRELCEHLPRRAPTGDEALREVLRLAQEIDS